MKVTLTTENIKTINLFQNLTGSHVLDCMSDGELYFVVSEGEYGLVIGKNGSKIKNAERVFKRPIVVLEYSPNLERFIKNIVPESQEIIIKEKEIFVRVKPSDRPKVIGKGGKKIKIINHFLKRLYDIESMKIK